MNLHGSTYFARRPPYPPPQPWGMGSIGQNLTFSEHGHVAYQIKEKHECANMVENILPTDPLPLLHPALPLGMGLVGQINLFQNMVMLHIKLKETRMRQNGSKYFAYRLPYPLPPTLGKGSIDQNPTFLEHGHVSNKQKR